MESKKTVNRKTHFRAEEIAEHLNQKNCWNIDKNDVYLWGILALACFFSTIIFLMKKFELYIIVGSRWTVSSAFLFIVILTSGILLHRNLKKISRKRSKDKKSDIGNTIIVIWFLGMFLVALVCWCMNVSNKHTYNTYSNVKGGNKLITEEQVRGDAGFVKFYYKNSLGISKYTGCEVITANKYYPFSEGDFDLEWKDSERVVVKYGYGRNDKYEKIEINMGHN